MPLSRDALENVLNKVTEEARRESMKIIQDGLAQSNEVLDVQESETMKEVLKITEAKNRQVEVVTRKALGSADLAARNKILQLVESTISRAFEEGMRKVPQEKAYQRILKEVMKEATGVLGTRGVVISCNARDRKIVEELASQLATEGKMQFKVDEKPLDCIGGVVLRSVEGSMIYSNTVEARLERMRPALRKKVFDLIMKEVE